MLMNSFSLGACMIMLSDVASEIVAVVHASNKLTLLFLVYSKIVKIPSIPVRVFRYQRLCVSVRFYTFVLRVCMQVARCSRSTEQQ